MNTKTFRAADAVAIAIMSVVGLLSAPPATANVSLKNGNFFIGYLDLLYSGGFEPKIERVYNSKSTYRGIFGANWGNEYEVYLTVAPDGSVVVNEYGGGAENRFVPVGAKAQDIVNAVELISKAAQQTGFMSKPDALAAYKKRLQAEAGFRNQEWERFRLAGKVQPRKIADGTQLTSNRFSYQYITKLPGGYQRTFDTGRVDRFDETGHLLKTSDKNGNSIELSYGKDGRLQKILDNFNRKIFFSFDNRNRVEKISGESGKEATYKYNDKDELVFSKDADGNTFTYKYSTDGRHGLTEIVYGDRSTMQIAYHGPDKLVSVKSVKDRDGSTVDYDYEMDGVQKGRVAVSITNKGKDGKIVSTSKYEYLVKYRPDGDEWNYKMVATLDGEKTETTYNECCGLPLLIKRGSDETSFEYDRKGRVTKKVTSGEITELAYDAKSSKVSRVAHYSKQNKKDTRWSEFQYDDKGNLLFAKNSSGKGVKLFYDGNGRIKSLLDQSKRRLDFKYNEASKPIEIIDPALGSITVAYSNSGEIKKVESSAGRKIAMEVTSAFQNLLDIIRPAGVSLAL